MPDPLGPMTALSEPEGRSKLSPLRARIDPKSTVRSWALTPADGGGKWETAELEADEMDEAGRPETGEPETDETGREPEAAREAREKEPAEPEAAET